MFNFSSNNLVWISTKEHERYYVHQMMDTDTKRCYWVYDFKKAMKFEDGLNYCVSGKVNSAEKLYLVAENMKVKPVKKCDRIKDMSLIK
ncbi:MAG: hypothetical protein DDT32_01553 [Syntrophomonadaceae bacterium]|nr:hypothetical protein [Bacillota bacterium]